MGRFLAAKRSLLLTKIKTLLFRSLKNSGDKNNGLTGTHYLEVVVASSISEGDFDEGNVQIVEGEES